MGDERRTSPDRGPGALPVEDALQLLRHGELELEGRLLGASNVTLRAQITLDGVTARCVYKPIRGERPLWDFPHGTLAGREVAAYLVSEAAGWGLVPPTVLRSGPIGEGACQLWIDECEDAEPLVGFVPADSLPPGWLKVADAEDEDGAPYLLAHADDENLAKLAVLDAVVNNADRKGGHVLRTADRIYGVDHGVCFHVEDKLRTVLWGWVGRPLPERDALAALAAALAGELGERLAELLLPEEVEATANRVDRLLTEGVFPPPSPGWPAVPWPPM